MNHAFSGPSALDPFGFTQTLGGWWRWSTQVAGIAWGRALGPKGLETLRRQRFDALVRHARDHSPLYQELYRELPPDPAPSSLPTVDKRLLMARFDQWVTDSRVTRAGVEAFAADPSMIGAPYLGQYAVWSSSGSSGVPGLFVHDRQSLDVYDALVGYQFQSASRTRRLAWGFAQGGRSAMVVATGGHFASVATAVRMQRENPLLSTRVFPVTLPIEQLVAELNAYRPSFLSTYPTAMSVLAQERAAGRLHIDPIALWTGGECLSEAARAAIESAFGCAVTNEYGASECLSIAFGCDEGWLHLNADWVMLEPVDREHRPTPPGQPSHTVLLTNLANRVQPLIRYDIGDSVEMHPGACRCGNPMPALRVDGRRGDVLCLCGAGGRLVNVLPLALTSSVETVPGVHRFQIVQAAEDSLRVRLQPAPGQDRARLWLAVRTAIYAFLDGQGLGNVRLALDRAPPRQDARSGKMHEVLARPVNAARGRMT